MRRDKQCLIKYQKSKEGTGIAGLPDRCDQEKSSDGHCRLCRASVREFPYKDARGQNWTSLLQSGAGGCTGLPGQQEEINQQLPGLTSNEKQEEKPRIGAGSSDKHRCLVLNIYRSQTPNIKFLCGKLIRESVAVIQVRADTLQEENNHPLDLIKS